MACAKDPPGSQPPPMACSTDALKCLICHETFRTEDDLRTHVEESYVVLEVRFCHEPNTMRYFKRCRPCQACQINRTFTSITDIMVHFQRCHPPEVTRASVRLTNFLFDALADPWTREAYIDICLTAFIFNLNSTVLHDGIKWFCVFLNNYFSTYFAWLTNFLFGWGSLLSMLISPWAQFRGVEYMPEDSWPK